MYFGSGACVHKWKEEQTKTSLNFTEYIKTKNNIKEDEYIYEYNNNESIQYEKIDQELSGTKSINTKVEYLKLLANNNNKNRFVHEIQIKKLKKKRK